MSSVKAVALAGAAVFFGTSAMAADLPLAPRPVPVVESFGSGWYLRGDLGFSNQWVDRLSDVTDNLPGVTNATYLNKGFDAAPFFGGGVGYQFNHWLRGDVTGEYRGNANFHALESYQFGGGIFDDNYTASKSEVTVLANIYFDLGSWYNITPFVGAGIGASRNTISNFRDIGLITPAGGGSDAYADSASQWDLAWAVHAGLAFKVTPNLTIELAYRYLNLGDAHSGDIIAYNGNNANFNPLVFHGLSSNDVKLGIRWQLDPVVPVPFFAPLSSRG